MLVLRIGTPVFLLLSVAALPAVANPVLPSARTGCTLPSLAISAPARAYSTESGLRASVPSNSARGYVWTVTNGSIDFGQGTHAIRFRAGDSGVTTVEVFEEDATLCVSPTARATVIEPPRLVRPVLSSSRRHSRRRARRGSFFTSELTLTDPERRRRR
ncbi:MAG: hypothetical protein IPP07_22545 [Holophagales bacterium]|nr:hypothetical protein [Holophagales bacterium]